MRPWLQIRCIPVRIPGLRGSRGFPRYAAGVPNATRMIAGGAAGNMRAAMADLEVWMGCNGEAPPGNHLEVPLKHTTGD